MKGASASTERARINLQYKLDSKRSQAERNRMGQFATPTSLALDILQYAREILPRSSSVRFLDPAIGTGSFYSALKKVFKNSRIERAMGFEVDPYYGLPSEELWRGSNLELRLEDFTRAQPLAEEEGFNLIICNPPYVRHHHLEGEEKLRLQGVVRGTCGLELNGLAGLYCYFIGLSHVWMSEGAVAGWLVPSEFMDVNYGSGLKRYLLDKVSLIHVHRFDPQDVQFADALVSSCVVWFRNTKPPLTHQVRFTFGGSLRGPAHSGWVTTESLRNTRKWTRFPAGTEATDNSTPTLGDYFSIKRGLATGHNGFFILPVARVQALGLPVNLFRPILPSPRFMEEDEVAGDALGRPRIDRQLLLLDCDLPEDQIKTAHPELWKYLQEGRNLGVHTRYLCKHRTPWYSQEHRPPAPFLCTYLGRRSAGRTLPFRFILNDSNATAANVYLMLYPRPPLERLLRERRQLRRQLWQLLNGLSPDVMLSEGRVYGGALHKLEPRELAKVRAVEIAGLLPELKAAERITQGSLFEGATT